MEKFKSIAIVPARGGSKGLRDKNIKNVGDYPLICHTLKQLSKCQRIDKILLSTDSQKIKKVAENHGFIVPFLRDPFFAQDETTMEATLQHALKKSEEYWETKFDICIYASPTDIFRESSWIDKLVTKLQTDNSLESAFMGIRTFRNYWQFKEEKNNYQRVLDYMKIFGQRQERLINNRFIVKECTGIGCASRSFLWREGRRIGDKVHIELLPNDYQECDIHTSIDLQVLNTLYNAKKKFD